MKVICVANCSQISVFLCVWGQTTTDQSSFDTKQILRKGKQINKEMKFHFLQKSLMIRFHGTGL
jgi:hypothetical protein